MMAGFAIDGSTIGDYYNAISMILATAVFALLLVIVSRRKRDQDHLEIIRSKDGRLQRPLGEEEWAFASMGTDGSGNDLTVLFIESKISLHTDLVHKALCLINQRYPLLSMKVHKNAVDGTLWFKEMDDPSRVLFSKREKHNAREWIQVFEEESRVSFDMLNGPLWRVIMLQEHYDEEEQQYQNSLLFTIHHMICDGASIMALYSQFLEYLNDLQQGKDIQVQSMALLPPCSYLMGSKMNASIFERIVFALMPYVLKVKSLFTKPTMNLVMKVFPPPILQDPSIVKKTSIIPKIIKAQELSKLIKIGKKHHCTVHGIITAATRLAMARILQSGKDYQLPNPLQFISSFNVSLRKECYPEVKMDQFGSFISGTQISIPTPCSPNITPEVFWKYAQECNNANHKKLAAKEHYQLFKMMKYVDLKSMFSTLTADISNGGRYDTMFNISNRGRFTIGDESKNVAFNFAGTYFAMAEQHTGPPLANNVVSVNGDLYWGLIYYPNITTKELADQFIEMSMSILRYALTDE